MSVMAISEIDFELLPNLAKRIGANPQELIETQRIVVAVSVFQSLLLEHLIEEGALKISTQKPDHIQLSKIKVEDCVEKLEEIVSGREQEYSDAGINKENFERYVKLFKNPPQDSEMILSLGRPGCQFSLGCPTRHDHIKKDYNIEYQAGHTLAKRWYSLDRKPRATQDECWLHNEMKSSNPWMDIGNLKFHVFESAILSNQEEESLWQ